jgi:formylglycine-generating enzyme required for sulfatase activity
MPKVGEQVEGYTLVKRIGRGSFGQVWLAEDQTGFVITQVAIKFIEDYEDTQFELVEREAKVWAEASGHPNILPIMKAKKYDDQVIFISEYAKEGSLQNWLKANNDKAPDEKSAIKIMLGILTGLEHLHSKRIVHRDLKPANILLQNGIPKLADFGLSRVLKTTIKSNTSVSGTSAYMSPETYRGKRTEQVDIWAVGVIFYQLLSGKLPFPEDDQFALMRAVNEDSPQALPASVSKPLQEIVFRALEKDLEKRFKTATEMKSALEVALTQPTIAVVANTQPQPPPSVEVIKIVEPKSPEVEPKSSPAIPPTVKVPPPKPVEASKPPVVTPSRFPIETKKNSQSKIILVVSVVVALALISILRIAYSYWSPLAPTTVSTQTPTVKTPAVVETPALESLLKSFTFNTVKLDSSGKEVERKAGQAQYYEEDLGHGVKLEMVKVPAGAFMMGTSDSEVNSIVANYTKTSIYAKEDALKYVGWETPQHQVTLSSFYIGKYEVTQEQWEIIMGKNSSNFKGSKLPVEQVSWNEAVEFCKKLSAKTGKQYRLPSEAEWEYAARGGKTTPFGLGETITPSIVNYDGIYPYANAPKGEYRAKTVEVGSLGIANGYGLYDMSGNVWEWCQDPWHESYKDAPTDGRVWEEGADNSRRVVRGGSWNNNSNNCRAANRNRNAPGDNNNNNGLRVVLVAQTLPNQS